MTTDPTDVIRYHLQSLTAKTARLRAQLDALELERREYETALKVYERIGSAPARPAEGRSEQEVPTIPDLIVKALETGPKPIADLTSAVMAMSDRPMDANNIRSTAWRIWRAERIAKTGDDYHLIGDTPSNGQNDLGV